METDTPKPHMVKQVITFDDGSETVINYRGKFVDGQLVLDAVPSDAVETPIVETSETSEPKQSEEEVSK